MARPTKWRKIEHVPLVKYFVPSEVDMEDLPENTLKLEELEAIRLKDLVGLEQGECAERMEISRPTFQRILLSAREKIADSLIHGKMIRICGGNFTRNICSMLCKECGKEWEESFEIVQQMKNGKCVCPSCGTINVACKDHCEDKFCRKNCGRHRGGQGQGQGQGKRLGEGNKEN